MPVFQGIENKSKGGRQNRQRERALKKTEGAKTSSESERLKQQGQALKPRAMSLA